MVGRAGTIIISTNIVISAMLASTNSMAVSGLLLTLAEISIYRSATYMSLYKSAR